MDDDGLSRIANAIRGGREYLAAHPDESRYTDSPATARLDEGLRVRVEGPDGASVIADMPPSIGGGGAGPSPGWYMRAGHAACVAALVAMRAAEEGVRLTSLEVTVDSESDDRGILGVSVDVPPGPLSSRVRIRMAAARETDTDQLQAIADWGWRYCPVDDAMRRAVPVSVEVDLGGS